MRNELLIKARKLTGRSRASFANLSKIPVNSYKSYEVISKKPRVKRARKILETFRMLGVNCTMAVFYPEIKEDINDNDIKKHL